MKQKKMTSAFFGGILSENVALRLAVALCATLAVTSTAGNGLGLGLATAVALVLSNLLIALVRNLLSETVRPFAFVLIIGMVVTVVQMLFAVSMPALQNQLGIYIPLMAVSCMLLSRLHAEKLGLVSAGIDGIVVGLLFAVALLVLSVVREVLGYGTLFGATLFGEAFEPALIIKAVPGGLMLLGVAFGIINHCIGKNKKAEPQEGGANV